MLKWQILLRVFYHNKKHTWFQTSSLQKCKRINFHCLKPSHPQFLKKDQECETKQKQTQNKTHCKELKKDDSKACVNIYIYA